jgi:hypothetical protein
VVNHEKASQTGLKPSYRVIEDAAGKVCHEHALFYCQVYATQGVSPELLAVSHGTLKKR